MIDPIHCNDDMSLFRHLPLCPSFCMSPLVDQVEYGWIQELLGARDEALQLDYQAVLSAGAGGGGGRTKESALALAALGHFFHVRGDSTRAAAYYHRCLHQHPNSSYCLLLSACLEATEVAAKEGTASTHTMMTGAGTAAEKHILRVNEDDEAIDARFRRGLFFMQSPDSNRWVGLLAYGDFITSRLHDHSRAEDVLWEAARLSCKYSVWAVVALAHLYQYVWEDQAKARKVRRKTPSCSVLASLYLWWTGNVVGGAQESSAYC